MASDGMHYLMTVRILDGIIGCSQDEIFRVRHTYRFLSSQHFEDRQIENNNVECNCVHVEHIEERLDS